MTETLELKGGAYRIVDLVGEDGALPPIKATRVAFLGPAVLVVTGNVKLTVRGYCQINDAGGGPEALVWEIDRARKIVVGGIALTDSTFEECTFAGIGIAGSHDDVMTFFNAVTVGR